MAKLIQVTEAARRLGVHRQTLENWAARGIINIKKMKNVHFVDADLIEKIGDLSSDVEKSRQLLEELKAEYDRERQEKWQAHFDENLKRRYLNLCVEGSARSEFFKTVVTLLTYNDCLTEQEGEILARNLNGEKLDDICKDYGIKRERTRQIVEKAIRKSQSIGVIKERLDEIKRLKSDNEALKATIKDFQVKLKCQEKAEEQKKKESEEAYKQKLMDNDAMCQLLSTRIVDCNLSVRCLNILRNSFDGFTPIETIGDLIKQNKTDILKRRNAGWKTLNELDDLVCSLNLEWGTDTDKIYQERVAFLMANDEENKESATL